MAYEEGMPVVVNPGIIDPGEFLEEVLTERFPNPFLPDTPQRILMSFMPSDASCSSTLASGRGVILSIIDQG